MGDACPPRRDLLTLQRSLQLPTILVTDDPGEAYLLADQLAVLVEGKLLQRAMPGSGRGGPVNREVAQLTGSRNFFRARCLMRRGGLTVRVGQVLIHTPALGSLARRPVTLAVRSERIMLVRKEAQPLGQGDTLHGVVVDDCPTVSPAPFPSAPTQTSG